MSYLYGDGTPSGLTVNFIELLRRVVDMSVTVVRADGLIEEGRRRRATREARNEVELEALEALVESVHRSLGGETRPEGSDPSPASRCADSIARWALEASRTEREKAKASLAADLAALEQEAARLRAECAKALETLVVKHDLPDAVSTIHVAGGAARITQATPYGVGATIAVDIPADSAFAGDLRVERLLDGVELSAPESGGMFRKQVRLVPHKLGKHHVTDVIVTADSVRVQLRETLEKGAHGFDVEIRERGLTVTRLAKDGETPITDATDGEVAKFRELATKLRAAAAELTARKSLVTATLDGSALTEVERPIQLVERLVEAMASSVKEIVAHSLVPGELVLKRMLGDDRREEIFVSASELKAKLEPLSEAARAVFAPLGLAPRAPAGVSTSPLASGSAAPAEPSEPEIQVIRHVLTPPRPPASKSPRAPTSELTEADVVESVDDAWLPPPIGR